MNKNSAMEEERLTRKERDRLRQRKEILYAALELFSQKGYDNVTMQEVAQKAEYAVGTLYNLFENKRELYKAILLEHCHRFHEKVVSALEKASDEISALKNYLRAKIEIFKENIPLIRLYMKETQGAKFNPKAGIEGELRDLYNSFLGKLASVFEAGIQKGLFRNNLRPKDLAVALDALSTALLFEWVEDPESNPYPGDEDYMLSFLFEPLLWKGGHNA